MTTQKHHPHIPLTEVKSSQIHAIGFDPLTNTLAVQFKSKHGAGSIYNYPDFSPKLYAQFEAAASKGMFFGQHVKPRKDYVCVSDAPQKAVA